MAQKGKSGPSCCMPSPRETSSCRVEAVVSIDERGQMVLPKEIRDRIKVSAGDKLAIISWEKGGKVCCLSLVKVDELAEIVRCTLGPVMKEILQ